MVVCFVFEAEGPTPVPLLLVWVWVGGRRLSGPLIVSPAPYLPLMCGVQSSGLGVGQGP